MMKKREAAVIGAYTGILCGSFSDMHAYIEELMGRPVFTHELASDAICKEIKKRAAPDFLRLCESIED